jgi:hypothetical protein
MTEKSFDILEMIPRDDPPKPKPRARIDPIFADLGEWSKRAVRVHYPELVDKLIKE